MTGCSFAEAMEHAFRRMDEKELHRTLVRAFITRGVPAASVRIKHDFCMWPETKIEVTSMMGNVHTEFLEERHCWSMEQFKAHLWTQFDRVAANYKAKFYPKTPLPFAE